MQHRLPTVICVVGAGHSGSTLFDALLGNHSAVSGVGEVQRISVEPESNVCGCGRPILQCPYWGGVAVEMSRRLDAPVSSYADYPITVLGKRKALPRRVPTPDEMVLMLGSRRLLRTGARVSRSLREVRSAAQRSWVLFEAVAAFDGSSVVVDTSKDSHRMKYLYLEHPQRTKVIHLVRDGRGVAASYVRRRVASLEEMARMWRTRNRNAELMLASIPRHRRMRLRYEDLCTDLEGELSRVLRFAGIESEEDVGRLGVRELHSIPGNPAFLQRRDIVVRLDERWRRELDDEDFEVFDRVAGRRNRRYGYK